MRRRLVPFFPLLLVLVSCHDDDDGFGFDNTYLPLSVGNYWEFSQISMLPTQPPITEHREVMSKVSLNSHDYFLVVSTQQSVNGPFVDSLYYRIGANGYVYTYRKNENGEAQDYRLAGKDGDRWAYSYLNQETQVTLTEDSIVLSSGPLRNCKNYYRDTITSADEEYTISLAPGVGFVKEFSNAWGGGKILRKARINGAVRTF